MRNAAKRQPSEETRDHHGQFKERQKAREISKARNESRSGSRYEAMWTLNSLRA